MLWSENLHFYAMVRGTCIRGFVLSTLGKECDAKASLWMHLSAVIAKFKHGLGLLHYRVVLFT